MLILMTSPDTICNAPDPDKLCSVLAEASRQGYVVVVASNHAKPNWFDDVFANSSVKFEHAIGRQRGDIVKKTATSCGLQTHDVLVLSGNEADMRMAKAGGGVLIAAQWSNLEKIRNLGIRVSGATELETILKLNLDWSAEWFYGGEDGFYSVAALADLSTYGRDHAMANFARQLTTTVKGGDARLNSLLTITARSFMMIGWDQVPNLAWGIYPSSGSKNDDSDVLADFGHRLRTTVSNVHYAKRGQPLFIRHGPSIKRSAGGMVDRTDPSDQITSLHLNPFYKGKLLNRHVILLDDCTTYGVSFGVAAAFLRSAGAASLTGIALGKFGNQLRYYDIVIEDAPFAPVENYSVRETRHFDGNVVNPSIQRDLRELI